MTTAAVEGFRLSPQQRRLWHLLKRPGAYRVQAMVGIEGELRRDVLRRALGQVGARHEILHTTFHDLAGMGMPVQTVGLPDGGPQWIEPRSLPAGQRQSSARDWPQPALRQMLHRELHRQSDEAPWRACLIPLASRRHALLLSLSPLVADARSLDNLLRDLADFYSERQPVGEEPLQYADYSEWQNELLVEEGGEASSGKEFWRHLESQLPSTFIFPWAAVESAGGPELAEGFYPQQLSVPLSIGDTGPLAALADRCGADLAELLLACWQVTCWRLSGQDEALVGRVFEGRKYDELQAAVGPFARSLPISCWPRADLSLSEYLGKVAAACRDASAWQEHYPGLGAAYLPLSFEFVELPTPHSAGGVTFTLLEQDACLERHDVKLTCSYGVAGLRARLSFDRRRFRARDVGIIGRSFARLLRSIGSQSQVAEVFLDELEVLSSVDHRRCLGARLDPPPSVGVHRLVEDQAARTAEAEAFVCGEYRLTYRQLNRRSNRLARALRDRGVGPETPVALLFDRSPEMVVALLAVLKAGGAYVALDPAAPPHRLAALLADTGAPWLLTVRDLHERLPQRAADVLCLDRDRAEIEQMPAGDLDPLTGLDHLAYIAYTSGSTGQPKGILGHHRGVAHYLRYVQETYDLSTGDTVLQLAPLTFDASVRDILGPLTVGARVVVPTDSEIAKPATLLALIREYRVDALLSVVPTVLRGLLRAAEDGEDGACSSVRLVLSSGESLFAADVQRTRDVFEGAQLVNQYGPSETTMTTTYHQVMPGDDEVEDGEATRRPISIGKPIPGSHLEVMNSNLRAVPPALVGEILLGGAGLTRGYLHRPGQTAGLFLPDPYSDEPGSRLYRTGDLGRLDVDGRLSFLGRRDQQVKIRGVRVEFGEVEAALARHAAVREVAVACSETADDSALVAYAVVGPESGATPRELKRFLYDRLPAAMLPARIICLAAPLPRTATGKVDRNALAEQETPKPARASSQDPPGPVEEILSGIMAEVLGRGEVAVRDNFFELGGHSLLATQVMARIQQTFDVDLPLRILFEAATVVELAPLVQAAMASASGLRPPSIVPVARDRELPLSFAQQRLWFQHQLDPRDYSYAVPRVVRMHGRLEIVQLERALNEISRRHEILRTVFEMVGEEPRQVIVAHRNQALPLVDLEALPPALREVESERLIQRVIRYPFDLERGPLLRVVLLRLADREHATLLVLHHVVCDAWSMGVLAHELTILYGAYLRGEPSPLPEIPLQYVDFAVWQRRWLAGEVLEQHLAYWRRQLDGGLPGLRLPTRGGRQTALSTRGARHGFTVPSEISVALRQLAREEDATLFMVLLAALQVFLHPYARGRRLAVGTDIANRTQPEIEGLIGFFINLLVLVVDLGGDPTFRELLARVRDVALDAYAHRSLPFEKLVEDLRPERSAAGHATFFQVLFVLQNAQRAHLEMPGLDLDPVWVDTRTSKFDLLLNMFDGEGELSGVWNYKRDLFSSTTITGLVETFVALLARIITQPDARLSQLEARGTSSSISIRGARQKGMEKMATKNSKLEVFKKMKPQAVQLSRESLVRMRPFVESSQLPLLVEPAGLEIDLIDWASSNRQLLDEKLLEHGAILFRRFGVDTTEEFQRFCETQCGQLFGEYGDLPRDSVGGKIYGATPYPPEERILYHNESSQMQSWPLKQFFCCLIPAAEGGETPIVDCRKVYEELDPQIRDRFREKKLMYTRNFTEGLGVDLKEFFDTDDREAIERFCREAKIEFEWLEDSSFRTRSICPAVARHPKTGARVFFNQVQAHHVSFLKPEIRESLMLEFGKEEKLPRNVFFGDGSPIDDSIMREVLEIYEKNAVSFSWQKGDVLMVDNMLTAHSRNSFRGPRKIVVAMGEMVSAEEVEA